MKKICVLDVHKDSIFCTICNVEKYSEVKEYETTTISGEYLQFENITESAMEIIGI